MPSTTAFATSRTRAGSRRTCRTPRYVELPGGDHVPWFEPSRVIAEIREFLTGSREAEEPDRILATVLFTDIVGSTELATTLGDSRWRELLDLHHAAVRRELERFRGREVSTAGDGFLAVFDGPARAIRAARAMIDAVGPLGIAIRAGVHTGEVEELPSGDIRGIAVHLGARVAAQAAAGRGAHFVVRARSRSRIRAALRRPRVSPSQGHRGRTAAVRAGRLSLAARGGRW